jgi:hypothetical protein
MEYSTLGSQCLPGETAKMNSVAPSYLAVVAPTILDLVLLVLTIVKAFKVSESYPSSPIVRVVLDFGLSLKPIYIHQDARVVAPRAFVRGTVSHYEADSYMFASQVFCHNCESSQIS